MSPPGLHVSNVPLSLDDILNELTDRGIDELRPWTPGGSANEFGAGAYALGLGSSPLEVCVIPSAGRPKRDAVRELWKTRQGRQASPLLLICPFLVDGQKLARAAGPTEQDLAVPEVDLDLAIGLAVAALGEPSGPAAIRYLRQHAPSETREFTGLRNLGMFAAHTLAVRVRERPDWSDAVTRGEKLRGEAGRGLIAALGFTIERDNSPVALLRSSGEHARGVAVFLDRQESYETSGGRFGESSALSLAFTRADRDNIPFVVLTRGPEIRLYAASGYEGVGRKGQAETYIQADVGLLASDEAGYLPLIFSADALAPGGSFGAILEWSKDFSAGLSVRLRQRVYDDVVPRLAVAIAREHSKRQDDAKRDLALLYEETLVLLFRLLFIAYAEDRDLLPYRSNRGYQRAALKTVARELCDHSNDGRSWDGNHNANLWIDVFQLFVAVDKGNDAWGVPQYNGGLFSKDPYLSPTGAAIAQIQLPDEEFGPALTALLTEPGDDGVFGPVDFRSLSVRDFGTIYEGLLESSLSVATTDLVLDAQSNYVQAAPGQQIEVTDGSIYHHNRSGARKATGSYFTKDFAVEHLLERVLQPTLAKHLAEVESLLVAGDEDLAAARLFDFRCVDLSMGSGHFLVAAVDHVERALARFLDEHPIPAVEAELEKLRAAAVNELGDSAIGYEIERRQLLRRQVARRCVYGVDLNEIAVELARLSLWIHTFVPGLPLSLLDHNLISGDSLTGIGTVDEAATYLTEQAGGKLSKHGQGSVFESVIMTWLEEAAEPLRRLGRAADATYPELSQARKAANDAHERVEPVRKLFDIIGAMRRGESAGFPAMLTTDAVEGHPQLAHATELAKVGRPIHFPVAFPEVFLRERPGFDCIIGNPPWEELTVEKSKWWNLRLPGLRSASEQTQRRLVAEYEQTYPQLLKEYEQALEGVESVRKLLAAGPFKTAGGDPDLYRFFAWRFWQLARQDGAIGVVLPQGLFASKGSGPWRRAVLPAARTSIVFCRNENGWLFDDVNAGYTITLACLHNVRGESGPELGNVNVVATITSELDLASSPNAVTLSAGEIEANDPDLCLPRIETSEDFGLFRALLRHPALGSTSRSDFEVFANTELHATNDRVEFFREAGDPVRNHLNVGHLEFVPGAGDFAYADVAQVAQSTHDRRIRSYGRKNVSVSRMPREWAMDPRTAPVLHPRIAIRDVIHASNSRKVWAALLPARTILTNKAPYLLFPRGSQLHQAYLLGMLGSSVCDWFGHLRVVLNLNFFILNALPIPDASEARCDWVERVAQLAIGVALGSAPPDADYGAWADVAVTVEDPADAHAELDALASLIYNLDEDQLPLVWNESHQNRPKLEAVLAHRAKLS